MSIVNTRCCVLGADVMRKKIELMKFQVDNVCKHVLIADNVKEMGKIKKTLQTTENI